MVTAFGDCGLGQTALDGIVIDDENVAWHGSFAKSRYGVGGHGSTWHTPLNDGSTKPVNGCLRHCLKFD
jgi:hypothetical protein